MASQHVVTRFSPSPTGLFHVGSARTALFNYLFAKQQGGKLILRIEDTDSGRSKKEYEENIIDGLDWLGINYDEFYRQSERGAVYRDHIEKLIAHGAAYESMEDEDGSDICLGGHHFRPSVIRFKNPGGTVSFHDEIRGEISFDVTELDDFVIAKNRETPLYHLAVVVDDMLMGVTHIIRGEDGISNTPRQLLIARALGVPEWRYAHIPLILAPDKSKLSKRHGAVAITEYRTQGYLPEALVNFLALIGWSSQGEGESEREIFSLPELVERFNLSKVQKSGAMFSADKLKWFNREYMKTLSDDELLNALTTRIPEQSPTILAKLLPLIRERITTLADTSTLIGNGGELSFVQNYTKPSRALLKTMEFLPCVRDILEQVSELDFKAAQIKERLWDFATEKGRGNVLWPLRIALTGLERSPDPFIAAELLGKEETLARIAYAQSLA